MKCFSFLESGKLKAKEKGILIFFSSAISMILFWIFFVFGSIYMEIGENFSLFLIIFSAIAIACMIYGIKTSIKG